MAKKIELFDSNDQKCYPITREECVISSTGEILSNKLNDMKETITKIDNNLYPVELIIFNSYSDKLLERGIETDIRITWEIKRQDKTLVPDSIKINGIIIDNPNDTSYVFEGVKDDLEITLEVSTEEIITIETTYVKFTSPIYIGFDNSLEVIPMSIENLKKFIVEDIHQEFFHIENNTTGKYLWLCIPKEINIINYISSEGFLVPTKIFEDEKEINNIRYSCYRSESNINSGKMILKIN